MDILLIWGVGDTRYGDAVTGRWEMLMRYQQAAERSLTLGCESVKRTYRSSLPACPARC
jgi:hypothetical protein